MPKGKKSEDPEIIRDDLPLEEITPNEDTEKEKRRKHEEAAIRQRILDEIKKIKKKLRKKKKNIKINKQRL